LMDVVHSGIIGGELRFKSRGEDVEPSVSRDWRLESADGAGGLGVALLRARRAADPGWARERTQILWSRERRTDRADPPLSGCGVHARRGSGVPRSGQSSKSLMDAIDESQASGARDVHRASRGRESTD